MPRFFVTNDAIDESAGILRIAGEDAHHIGFSLRMAAGEEITVSNGEGLDYRCRLIALRPGTVEAAILSCLPCPAEPPLSLHLYMAYPKGDKLETVIQKATELGVATVTPFLSERCIRRPDREKTEKLSLRYNRIAREAAGQCGRGRLPRVNDPLSFEQMLVSATARGPALFCYEGEGATPLPTLLTSLPTPAALSVIVGSEGGFSPREAALAAEAGCLSCGLGPRILRCETAPLVALSCLLYHYEFGHSAQFLPHIQN